MNGFTKAAAFEYGDLGITVNAISPGAIETDLMMEAGPDAAASMGVTYEEFKDTYAQESAIKRLNTVEEVASLALYLVSEQAGGMTGAILPLMAAHPCRGGPHCPQIWSRYQSRKTSHERSQQFQVKEDDHDDDS